MPSADTMPGLSAAARITLPRRVRARPTPSTMAYALEDEPEDRGAGGAANNRQHEAAGRLIARHREIGAEHVKGAVGEIDDLEHAEDQGQPDRDKEQQHADDQPADGLRHQTGGTGKTAGERVEVQDKPPIAARRRFYPRENSGQMKRRRRASASLGPHA